MSPRRAVIWKSVLASTVLASTVLVAASPAAADLRLPLAATGKVTHPRGTSVLLTGSVNPEGSPTSYYFQFGPTPAYGSRTATASLPSGTSSVRVGLFATPFLLGYHFRLVATNAAGTKFGRDRVYTPKSTKFKIELAKDETHPWGTYVIVAGRITGTGSANHRIALQASPYPYKEAFEVIGAPTVSNAAGRFAFRVGVLSRSTQFRVVTLDPLPRFSKILHEFVSVRVTMKVRTSGKPGFVRIYGTVTPVQVGAKVEFQVLKSVRPGRSEKTEERTSKFVTQALSTVKRATRKLSRFSAIVALRRAGYYRARVLTGSGALVAGSSRVIFIRAPARRGKH